MRLAFNGNILSSSPDDRRHGHRWWGLVGLICLALFTLTGCPQTEEPLVVGAHMSWIGYQPLFLADDRGDLAPSGVRLVSMLNLPAAQSAIRHGRVDAIFGTLDEALRFRATGTNIMVILVSADSSLGADAIIGQAEVSSIKALRSRRVGLIGFGLSGYILMRALEQNGMTIDDIEIVPLAMDRQIEAFRNREVDAIVTFDPLIHEAHKAGGHTLFDTREMPGESIDVLMVRGDVTDADLDRLRHLLSLWFDSVTRALSGESRAIMLIGKRLGLAEAEVTDSLQKIRFLPPEEVKDLLAGREAKLIPVAERMQQTMLHNGLMEQPVAISELLAPQFNARLYDGLPRTYAGHLQPAH